MRKKLILSLIAFGGALLLIPILVSLPVVLISFVLVGVIGMLTQRKGLRDKPKNFEQRVYDKLKEKDELLHST